MHEFLDSFFFAQGRTSRHGGTTVEAWDKKWQFWTGIHYRFYAI
jgi:hypothetical protein